MNDEKLNLASAETLQKMGFEKVAHIEGGFGAIKQSKFKII